MPTRSVPAGLQQAALDLVEHYGSGYKALLAGKGGKIAARTIDHRAELARLNGMTPTKRKDAPRVYTKARLGRMHIVLPDVQARPGVNTDHLEHIGNYVAEKKPDEFVCIGDFADLPSLGSYDKGTLKAEGRRYNRDVDAARSAMARLMAPIDAEMKRAPWKMRRTFTKGNHEDRADRIANLMPELEGTISAKDLGYSDWGWEVHDFLKVVRIDGIEYCHYFTSGVMGRPVSSAAALLRERQGSATMGHVQHTDIAMHKKTQKIALFCGTAYTHDEDYLGPQGNSQRRQIIVKHEVEDGRYDPMFVSLAFLKKAYG
jgi:hypothetical protein